MLLPATKMDYRKNSSTWLMFLLLFVFACSADPKEGRQNPVPADPRDPLLKANQHLVRNEDQRIEAYIQRYQLILRQSASGLRYSITGKGEGNSLKEGDRVSLAYTLSLLDGSRLYSSDTDGRLEFTLGKAEMNNGLEEAILMMKTGNQAKIIVPSHLGYGLLGDGERIPARATLVYQINELKVISR